MVIIDAEKCVGCGRCVKDCFPQNIMIRNKKAATVHPSCFECGHCVAICPEGAVRIKGLDRGEVEAVTKKPIGSKKLLNLIKSRRSIRSFTAKPVSQKKLLRIIDAGRFTPTAGNTQGLSYVLIEKEIAKFRELIIHSLGRAGAAILSDASASDNMRAYAKRWVREEAMLKENATGKDSLFFGAPTVLLVVGDSLLDAGLAASNMELMAYTQGLGLLYSGFIARGCADETIKEFLGLAAGKQVLCALVIGHTDLKYQRTAPRKKAEIIWR